MKSMVTVMVLIFGLVQPAFATPGAKAYVANFKDNTVSVIDAVAAKVIATIPVDIGQHGMAITRDGRRVYVSGDGSSSVDCHCRRPRNRPDGDDRGWQCAP